MSELIHPIFDLTRTELGLGLNDRALTLEQIFSQGRETGFFVVERDAHLVVDESGRVGYSIGFPGNKYCVVAEAEFFLAVAPLNFDAEQLRAKYNSARSLLNDLGINSLGADFFHGGVLNDGSVGDLLLASSRAKLEIGWRRRELPPYEYHISDKSVLNLLRAESARKDNSLYIKEEDQEQVTMNLSFLFFPDERLAQLMYQYKLGRREGRVKQNPVLQKILGEDSLRIRSIPLNIVRAAVSGEANPYPELEPVGSRLEGLPAYSRLRARFEKLNVRDGLPRSVLTFGDLRDIILLAYGSADINIPSLALGEIYIIQNYLSVGASPSVPVDLGQLISTFESPEDPGSIGITSSEGYSLTIAKKQGSEDLYELVFPDLDEKDQYVAAIFREIGLPVRQ